MLVQNTYHWTTSKRILQYLHLTPDMGLSTMNSGSSVLSDFSDADYASNPDDRHSTSCYTVFFGGNLIFFWSSRKHRTVSHSSTEAGYKETTDATVELIWVQVMLRELDISEP